MRVSRCFVGVLLLVSDDREDGARDENQGNKELYLCGRNLHQLEKVGCGLFFSWRADGYLFLEMVLEVGSCYGGFSILFYAGSCMVKKGESEKDRKREKRKGMRERERALAD